MKRPWLGALLLLLLLTAGLGYVACLAVSTPTPPVSRESGDAEPAPYPPRLWEELARIGGLDVRRGAPGERPRPAAWQDGAGLPEIGSPKAVKGGRVRLSNTGPFPAHFLAFGSDAPQFFHYSCFTCVDVPLVRRHPATGDIIPGLAEAWAVEVRTVHFRLYPTARYSNGRPLRAADFALGVLLRFRATRGSGERDTLRATIEKLIIHDEHTLSVTLRRESPLAPCIAAAVLHPAEPGFYAEFGSDYLTRYARRIPPTTGAYTISRVETGRLIVLSRVRDWWARELPYHRYSCNVDDIEHHFLTDEAQAWEFFLRGRLDIMQTRHTAAWHRYTQSAFEASNAPDSFDTPSDRDTASTPSDLGTPSTRSTASTPSDLGTSSTRGTAFSPSTSGTSSTPSAPDGRCENIRSCGSNRLDEFNERGEQNGNGGRDKRGGRSRHLLCRTFRVDYPLPPYGIVLNAAALPDVALRQGLMHALDMDKAVSVLFRDEGERLTTFTTGYKGISPTRTPVRHYDPEAARACFRRAGYTCVGTDGILHKPDGTRLSITFTYVPSETVSTLAVILRQSAAACGADIRLEPVPWQTEAAMIAEGRHEMIFWASPAPLPLPDYARFFSSSARGYEASFRLNNPDMDAAIAAYNAARELSSRAACAARIDALLYEEAVWLPGWKENLVRLAHWSHIRFPEDMTHEALYDVAESHLYWEESS